VDLAWDPPSNNGGSPLTYYRVYRGTVSGGETFHNAFSASYTTYHNINLQNGVTYYYYVTALNSVGESDRSNEVSATPVGSTGTIIVQATLNGTSWSGNVSYQLTGPSSFSGSSVPSTFTSKPTGSWTLQYLSGGPGGTPSISPASTQTLSAGGTITFTLNFTNISKPSPPQNLQLAVKFATSTRKPGVRLTWSPPSYNGGSNISYYEMWRKEEGGTWKYMGTRPAEYTYFNDWGYPDPQLYLGKTYYYRLVAVNLNGLKSDPCPEVSIPVQVLIKTTTQAKVYYSTSIGSAVLVTLPVEWYGSAIAGPYYQEGYYWYYCFWVYNSTIYRGYCREIDLWFSPGP